jgi:hypothetical protein
MSTEDSANQEEIVQPETVAPVVEPAVAAPSEGGGLLNSILGLKDSNPKVFFGGIAGIAVLILVFAISGGDDKPALSGPVLKDLAIGQKYTLKSANAYDASATVRLVSTPGAIAAYDDTEEADRNGACQHLAQGTPVTVLEFADAYGKQKSYSKVRIEDGSCKGNEGWALSIDIQ